MRPGVVETPVIPTSGRLRQENYKVWARSFVLQEILSQNRDKTKQRKKVKWEEALCKKLRNHLHVTKNLLRLRGSCVHVSEH